MSERAKPTTEQLIAFSTPKHKVAFHEIGHASVIRRLSGMEERGISLQPDGTSQARTHYVIWEANPKRRAVKMMAAAYGSHPAQEKMGITGETGRGGDEGTMQQIWTGLRFAYGQPTADMLYQEAKSMAESIISSISQTEFLTEAIALTSEDIEVPWDWINSEDPEDKKE